MRFMFKSKDTKQPLCAQLTNEKGIIDLTGSTVKILITSFNRDKIVLDDVATITDAPNGKVEYIVGKSITIPETYLGEFEITFPDGKIELFPNEGQFIIGITPNLRDSVANDGGGFTPSPTPILDGGSF